MGSDDDMTSIRVKRSTVDKLNAFRASLITAAEMGRYRARKVHATLIPLDDCIVELCRRESDKKARAKKSAKTRKERHVYTIRPANDVAE